MRGYPLLLLAVVLVPLVTPLAAQPSAEGTGLVRARVGAEYANLGALRAWYDYEVEQLRRPRGAEVDAASRFPLYPTFGVQAGRNVGAGWTLGITARTGATDAQLTASTAPGAVIAREASLHWTARRYSAGLFAEQVLLRRDAARVYLALHTLAEYSVADHTERTRTNGRDVRNVTLTLRSKSIGLEFESGAERTAGPLLVGVRVGVGYTIYGPVEFEGERAAIPRAVEPFDIQWLGWRLGLHVGLPLR